jgi:DNA-binding MarR family transcriptional regulator
MYDAAMAESGLRSTQFALLTAAAAAGKTTIGELAEETVMDRTTLTRNLQILERDGMVRTEPGADDQRKRLVTVTSKGLEAIVQAAPFRAKAQRCVEEHLGEREFEKTLSSLHRLVDLSRAARTH